MLLLYAAGQSVSAVVRALGTNRPRVERTLDKVLQMGVSAAVPDMPGRGRPPRITTEAKALAVSLPCQKPKNLAYSCELWTTALLTHSNKAYRTCTRQEVRKSVRILYSHTGITFAREHIARSEF